MSEKTDSTFATIHEDVKGQTDAAIVNNSSSSSSNLEDNAISSSSTEANSLVTLASQWASNTGMHGLPNITRTSNRYKQAVWTLLLLGGIAAIMWQIQVIVNRYASYPIAREDADELVMPREFPAVTLCNQSPARLSSIRSSITQAVSSGTANLVEMAKLLSGGAYSGLEARDRTINSISDSAGLNYLFLDYYNSLNSDWRSKVGFDIEEILVDCSFGGLYCDKKNFTTYLHPIYGNCFTFNSNGNPTELLVEQTGPLYGLNLLLFANQEEYVGVAAQSAGFVVAVHERTKQPFPEDSGISAAPGFDTQIGITETRFTRLATPYKDDCQSEFVRANKELNMFSHLENYALPRINYSMAACMKTCAQLSIEQVCGCSSPRIPASWAGSESMSNRTDILSNFTDASARLCLYDFNLQWSNISQNALCAQRVEREAFSRCRSQCKQECDESIFDTSVSMATWPSLNYEEDALGMLFLSGGSSFRRSFVKYRSANEKRTFLSCNIVKLTVFLKSQVLHKHSSLPGYTIDAALSDTGGQVGLWLGLSVLTIFELVEMLVQIAYLTVAKLSQRHQLRSKISTESDTSQNTSLTSIAEAGLPKERKESVQVICGAFN